MAVFSASHPALIRSVSSATATGPASQMGSGINATRR